MFAKETWVPPPGGTAGRPVRKMPVRYREYVKNKDGDNFFLASKLEQAASPCHFVAFCGNKIFTRNTFVLFLYGASKNNKDFFSKLGGAAFKEIYPIHVHKEILAPTIRYACKCGLGGYVMLSGRF